MGRQFQHTAVLTEENHEMRQNFRQQAEIQTWYLASFLLGSIFK
jgi:hypothetical protein